MTAKNRESSRLLQLPPELRNRIYEHAVFDNVVMITPSLKQPSLLHSCKQIREEALGIFYANEFKLHIQDCDAGLLMAFSVHLKDVGHEDGVMRFSVGGKNWNNLQQWCLRIWAGDVRPLSARWSDLDKHGHAMMTVKTADVVAAQHQGNS